MKTSLADFNIKLYRVYAMFSDPLFRGPIIIMAMQKLGHMTLPQIYFMESLTMILCIALNIPAGALADMIGRKRALMIGRLFTLLDVIILATMTSTTHVWISNICWAFGYSFQSGADQALLYNSLKNEGRESEYTKIEGQSTGMKYVLFSITSLIAGFVADYNLRLPLLMSIPCILIPLVTAIFFREKKCDKDLCVKNQWDTMKKGISFAFKTKQVLWIIFFAALLSGASKIWFFTYNSYFENVGIDIKYFGVIFFFLNIVAWLSSRYAYRIREYFTDRNCVFLMYLLIGVPIVIMGLFPVWPMVILIGSQNIVRGFLSPFVSNFMNTNIKDEEIRATSLSVRSTFSDTITIFSLSWFGFMDKDFGMMNSLVILGLLVIVLGTIGFFHYRRLFPRIA